MIVKLISILIIFSYIFLGAYKPIFGLSIGSFLSIFVFPFSFLISTKILNKKDSEFLFLIFLLGLFFLVCRVILNYNFKILYVELYIIPVIYVINFYFFQKYFNNLFLPKLIIYLVLFSGVISLFQFFNFDFSWNLRLIIPNGLNDPFIYTQISERLKPAGLSLYSVQLSYQLTFASILSFYVFKKTSNNFYYKLIYLFLVLAFFSQAISSFISILLLILIYNQKKISFNYVIFSLFFLLILFYYLSIYEELIIVQRLLNPDGSILSRLSFVYVGYNILYNNLFGVPDADISNIKIETIQKINESLPLLMDIKSTSFHNTFINHGVSVGFISMILYLFFYYRLYKFFSLKYSFSFAFLFLPYLIQITTHNSGPYTSDFYFWIIVGILLGGLKLNNEINN